MTTVSQVMAEVGRLHMENLELRAANTALAQANQELLAKLERRDPKAPASIDEALKTPRTRGRRKASE